MLAVVVLLALLAPGGDDGAARRLLDAGERLSHAIAAGGVEGWAPKDPATGKRGPAPDAATRLERLVRADDICVAARIRDAHDAKTLTAFGRSGSGAREVRVPLLNAKGARGAWAILELTESRTAGGAVSNFRVTVLLVGLLGVVAAAGVAYAIANQVAAPLGALVQAVSRINRGNLSYRSTIRSRGEIGRLSRAIESMCDGLQEGEEAFALLSEHEKDARLVSELHQALIPRRLPEVEGFEVDAAHLPGSSGSTDFYDAVPVGEGRLAVVVAATSGSGALGALLGAMTRSSLCAYLEDAGDAGESLRRTNKKLAQAMRQGLHVTAQVAVLDPANQRATVHIAGHRAPFYACRAGEISVVHGEGLALGLDKGAVFDERLEEVIVDMPPGTRIVLTTTGTYELAGFGVEQFEALVRKQAPKNTHAFLNLVLGALEAQAGDAGRTQDATIVTAKTTI